MTKKLLRRDLLPLIKLIIRLRVDKRLNWKSIALAVLGELYPGEDYETEQITNVGRSAKRLFEEVCLMGFATPPPDDTAFHDSASPNRTSYTPPEFLDRLRELEAQADECEEDMREFLDTRIRSEKQLLTNLRAKASARVRHGRPFLDGEEASANLPPLFHYEGATKVKRPYPPVSDRDLLGGTRYDFLIAERVAEVEQNPDATFSDKYFAENPHELPLQPKGQVNYQMQLVPPDAEPNEILEAFRFTNVLVTTLLAASVSWEMKRGRRPAEVPSLEDIALALVAKVSSEQPPAHFSAAFCNYVSSLDQQTVVEFLLGRVKWFRKKYGFSAPLSPLVKQRLLNLEKVLPNVYPKTERGSAKESAEAWLGGPALKEISDFYHENLKFRL